MPQRDGGCAGVARRVGERAMTGGSRPILEGGAGIDHNADRSERQPALLRKHRNGVRLAGGSSPQPVVDVTDREANVPRWRKTRQCIEQCDRVGTTAARDEHRFATGNHVTTVEGRGHSAAHARGGSHPLSRRQRAPVRGGSWTRTRDIPGMNRLLYHLS
jgi:hypothetical protein